MSEKQQQQTLNEAQEVEDKAAKKKAQKEFDQAVADHKRKIKDYKNDKIQVDRVIDEVSDLNTGQMVQTDLVKKLRVQILIERVDFEKDAKKVEKSQHTYIGGLKSVSKMIDKKLADFELNGPEPADFGL